MGMKVSQWNVNIKFMISGSLGHIFQTSRALDSSGRGRRAGGGSQRDGDSRSS